MTTQNNLDQSKEMLVLSFFLFNGNNFASADRIVGYWSQKGSGTKCEALPRGVGPDDRSLSRAGAAKICRRLVSEGLLIMRVKRGYRNKLVHAYRLPSGQEFLIVAERIRKTYPILALRSDYGKEWLRDYALPHAAEVLGIKLGSWKKDAEWVVQRSPTAFGMIIDSSLESGGIANLSHEDERGAAFIEALICAIRVDKATGAGGLLLDDIELANALQRLGRHKHRLKPES